MVPLELKAPMGRDRDTEAGTESTTSPRMGVNPSRLPPQPMFNVKEFSVFLERWQRWTHLAGIDSLDEQAQRVWFLGAMEETVLTVVEAVFKRTTGVTELFIETGKVFPTYVSDFTLRGEIGAIPTLSGPPSMEDIEILVLRLETIWSRMSEGAVSDQDRMFTLVSKLPEMTWSKLKETAEMRKRLVGYASLKEAVRTLV